MSPFCKHPTKRGKKPILGGKTRSTSKITTFYPLTFYYFHLKQRRVYSEKKTLKWGFGHCPLHQLFSDNESGNIRWSSCSFEILTTWSSYHFRKPSSRALLIHWWRQESTASGMVSQLLLRVLCSGQSWSSSFTCKANIAALHNPSGQYSSCRVLLLNS